jgi:anti-anti-sigma regulatory factor
VRPRGELDLATAPELRHALSRARDDGALRIELDLTVLTFLRQQ